MKNIYLLLACALPLYLNAQDQGRVTYEERITMDLKMDLDGVENAEAIRAMLPKSHTVKKQLEFTPSASLYRNTETAEVPAAPLEETSGNVQVKMVIARPEEQLYRDLDAGTAVEKKDLFGRSFLISREESKASWKLSDEQKEILGYTCRKAVIKDSASVTEAWYAPAIPVSTGPAGYGQLPGLILEVSANNGKLVIAATEVKLGALEKKPEPPVKGRKVSPEEFRKIADEKAKEMQETMGGRGNIIIRRGN
jgi:GLPGLI family protein